MKTHKLHFLPAGSAAGLFWIANLSGKWYHYWWCAMAHRAESFNSSGDSPSPSSRERILESAKRLFANKGYESTSTMAIARAAGTSESQLMKHFGSKEGLLQAIFEQGWAAIGQTLAESGQAGSPAERLQRLVAAMHKSLEKDPELKLLMLLEGRRIRKEGQMVMLTEGYLKTVGLVDSTLKEMQAAGQLRSGLNLQSTRSALIGIFEGLLRDQVLGQRLNYPADFSAEDIRQTFNAALSGFLQPKP